MRIEPVINQKPRNKQRGFTLIELIVTTILIGILFSLVSGIITGPIIGYTRVSLRADLVEQAESALRRMERDLMRAIPNSIRVKNAVAGSAVEMVNAVEGIRYRSQGPGTNNTILDFSQAETDFNVLGNFQYAIADNTNHGYRLVIYNTGAYGNTMDNPIEGANVYGVQLMPDLMLPEQNPPAGTSVITLPTTLAVVLSSPGGTEDHVNISSPGFQFAFDSPNKTVYVTNGPISYVWDPAAQTITRYAGYTINETQPNSGTVNPLLSATSIGLLTQNVTSCVFNYIPGTAQRNSVLTITLTVSRNGESVTLLHQVSASNIP